jgi:hypothetical protein
MVLTPASRRPLASALAGTALLCAPAAAAGPAIRIDGAPPSSVATPSNLKTLSRWAYPQAAAEAHVRPFAGSRAIARLHFLTSDGQAEVYMALSSVSVGSETWILVSLPGRPNGVTGWVPAGALGELHASDERLRVDRETLRATLYRAGRVVWSAPVGVGRPRLPTPPGHFFITEKLAAFGGAFYGPYALGTSAYAPTLTDWPGGGVVGIHGTDEPQLIPGRPSHGCIRLRNADIERLWPLIAVGTPIEIV